jgi:hypothetical protein
LCHYGEKLMTPGIFVWLALLQGDLNAPRPIEELFSAIRAVESRGNDKAVGDGGRAIGAYQIHYAYWRDSGVPGRWKQCRNRKYAERVMRAYWRRFCPKALAAGDWQTLAMVHNGGPKGHVKRTALNYWRRLRCAIAYQDRTTIERSALKSSNSQNARSR